MRKFVLQRDVDETGVSGVGPVADGCVFDDPAEFRFPDGVRLWLPPGWVRLKWRGPKSSTSLWASTDMMLAVHGHNGLTRIVWADDGADQAAEQAAEEGSSGEPGALPVFTSCGLTSPDLVQAVRGLAVAARTVATAITGARSTGVGT